MGARNGSGFAIGAQPARSAKLRVYRYLFLLNHRLHETLEILKRLETCPGLRRDFLRAFQVEVEEFRAETNCELTELLSEREQDDWARFGKQRRRWLKRFEDPDDVYLGVERREAERLKQGLPPRLIGVLSHSVVAKEEERLRAKRQRKKKGRSQ
jgi:hypothetical protein